MGGAKEEGAGATSTAFRRRPALSVPLPSRGGGGARRLQGAGAGGPRTGGGAGARTTVQLGWQHLPLALLYLAVLRSCVRTAGRPYEAAVDAAKAAYAAKQALAPEPELAANATAAAPALPEVGEELDEGEGEEEGGAAWDSVADAAPAWEAEGAEGDVPPYLEGVALPNSFLPDFWPCFALVVVGILHGLLVLVQHWSVRAKCFIQYERVQALAEGCYVLVRPRNSRSKAELVPVFSGRSSRGTGQRSLFYVSHKEKIEVLADGGVLPVRAPVTLPLADYAKAEGIASAADVDYRLELYGRNKFEIPMPTFDVLYKQQLLQPLSVFQVFCVALWLLDEAWKYALFGLVSVLGFEATSVMTRLKNIQMIRGMGNMARTILVRRCSQWCKISTEDIVPGDVVSITIQEGSGGDVVPCDCLLLTGSAVVNEATLTGESVPQMKEAVPADRESLRAALDIKGEHKIHTLYGGTSLIQLSRENMGRLTAPDGGCVCYALRTGFSSSQGELVKMIEFSASTGGSSDPENLRQSVMMILLLLVFAIIASGFVLKQGLESGTRSRYELLVHCILIVTSVVPSDLPMQLALAVNASLMYLMKLQVFCTEPFRVPMAGKLDSCFFDKTGTLTTDRLQAVGVVARDGAGAGPSKGERALTPAAAAPLKVARILAGCHSLLKVDGKMLGDPIETEAMSAIKWEYNHEIQTAAPSSKGGATFPYSAQQQIRIIHRYHFASKLQRMSSIAAVVPPPSTEPGRPELRVLAKGSPEIIGTLLAPGEKPGWYDATYLQLAKRGMRVIALASRKIETLADGSPAADADEKVLGRQPRDWAEKDLAFAGFIAFKCLMRKDSAAVVKALQRSSHTVAMITGDNLLTAIHVAGEVGITGEADRVLILEAETDDALRTPLNWVNSETQAAHAPFDPAAVPGLAATHSLCVTGTTLRTAVGQYGPDLKRQLQHVHVFARMTPKDKELVLDALNENGHSTLMCGDGANDVGALKQAHVGVALLGGFGALNAVKEGEEEADAAGGVEVAAPPGGDQHLGFWERMKKQAAEAHEKQLALRKEAQSKQLEARQKRQKALELQKKNKEKLMKEVEEETLRLQEAGEGAMAPFKAMKIVYARQREEQRKKVKNSGGMFAMSAAAMAAQQEGGVEEGELPMLKLGDASIAAPFTSKWPSIKSVYDIVRQGRCTLVTSVQNNQILCLTSLISSYSLSVLYLDGIKFSDYQLTLTGVCMTASHLAVSYASPLKHISAARPLSSMFHPALFLSTLGQFAIHLGAMVYAVYRAKQYLPPGFTQGMQSEFEPNLINTVVFLIETVQQVTVLMVNYKGRPFQPAFTENKALLHSLGICGVGTFVCAYELIPKFNKWMGLVSFPDDSLRRTILVLLSVDVAGCLAWDRLMSLLFSPAIFRASLENTTLDELLLAARKLAASALAIYLLANETGLLGLGVIYWLYRNGFF